MRLGDFSGMSRRHRFFSHNALKRRRRSDYAFLGNTQPKAQEAASIASSAGMFDLSMELYREAPVKNARPLTLAISDDLEKDRLTEVLMVGHGALDDDEQGYVINHAISYLQ